jgi:hypothetical protein
MVRYPTFDPTCSTLNKKPIEVWEYSTGKYISFPMRYERNSDGNLPHSPFPTMVIPRELMRILPDVTGNGKSKLAAFIHELSGSIFFRGR